MRSATLDMDAMNKFREQFPFHLDADEFSVLASEQKRAALR
jgi:hypothetical protein